MKQDHARIIRGAIVHTKQLCSSWCCLQAAYPVVYIVQRTISDSF